MKRHSVARARLDRFRRPLPFSKARSYGNRRRTTGLPGSELNTLDLAPPFCSAAACAGQRWPSSRFATSSSRRSIGRWSISSARADISVLFRFPIGSKPPSMNGPKRPVSVTGGCFGASAAKARFGARASPKKSLAHREGQREARGHPKIGAPRLSSQLRTPLPCRRRRTGANPVSPRARFGRNYGAIFRVQATAAAGGQRQDWVGTVSTRTNNPPGGFFPESPLFYPQCLFSIGRRSG